jgi:hypothetical protein
MTLANPNNIRQVKTVRVATDLLCLTLVPGTSRLWAGGADGKLYHVDLAATNPQPESLQGHASYVSGLVLTANHLISAGWDRRLTWWDKETRRQIRSLEAHRSWIRQLAITPNCRTVVSIADDMTCRVWDAGTGELRHELVGGHALKTPQHFPSKLYACTVSADGRYLATGDAVGHVVVWNLAAGRQEAAFDAPIYYVWDFDRNNHGYGGLRVLAFSPDANQLALGGMENKDVAIINGIPMVSLYNWRTGALTHEFKIGRDFQFENLCYSQRGDWLVAASGGGGAKMAFFDPERRQVIRELTPPTNLFGLALGENSEMLVGVGRNQIVQWDLRAAQGT